MATDVFYVRHGEIAAKEPGDLGLSPAGREMAAQAGRVPAVDISADVPYCSITHLVWHEGQVRVRAFASTEHLDEVRTTRAD